MCRYELFLPLNTLWKGYMSEIFGSTTPTAFTQKLLKADLHGAVITGEWTEVKHAGGAFILSRMDQVE